MSNEKLNVFGYAADPYKDEVVDRRIKSEKEAAIEMAVGMGLGTNVQFLKKDTPDSLRKEIEELKEKLLCHDLRKERDRLQKELMDSETVWIASTPTWFSEGSLYKKGSK